MIGTAMAGGGGIATVVKGYRDSGFMQSNNFIYIASHRADYNMLSNLFVFLVSILKVLIVLVFRQVSIAHIHVASRGSFYRKSIFIILLKFFRVKVVFHLHGGEFKIFYENESGTYKKNFIADRLKQADIIIVLSESWKNWIAGIVGANHPIVVVYNSIAEMSCMSRPVRGSDILFLGRIEAKKGVQELLIAFKAVLDKGQETRLVLCGHGQLDEYQAVAVRLGIASYVDFKGWIGPEERCRYLTDAGMLVLPSFHEGFPMSIIEAMSAGMPIVATNVGGIPEAIVDGVSGLLVQPGDPSALAAAMTKFLDDPGFAHRCGEAAQNYFELNFSNKVCYPKIVSAVYQRIIC